MPNSICRIFRGNPGEPVGDRAAEAGQLPDLIGYGDLRGDLHVHCNWNGGANSIEEIVEAALALGYEYVGISDHTKYLKIERGLDEDQLIARNKEIDQLNDKLAGKGKASGPQGLRGQHPGGWRDRYRG